MLHLTCLKFKQKKNQFCRCLFDNWFYTLTWNLTILTGWKLLFQSKSLLGKSYSTTACVYKYVHLYGNSVNVLSVDSRSSGHCRNYWVL